MNRKLASIQVVSEIRPIEGADKIEVARINNWDVVIRKDEYNVGDFCIYCEIDAFLPIRDEFEFLRKSSFKKMGDEQGFRLKTIRLRKQISQGLLLPLSILPMSVIHFQGMDMSSDGYPTMVGMIQYADHIQEFQGADVTEILGIVKYEPPIPAELAGKMKGNFPSFVSKTDEERIQNMTHEFEDMKHLQRTTGLKLYETEKLDGSSTTYYDFPITGEFGVCSRNIDLLETEGNTFWKVARELNIEEILSNYPGNVSIQGELIGEGIQKNRYKLKGHTVKFFNLFDIDDHERCDFEHFREFMNQNELETVPIIDDDFQLPDTIDELLVYVQGKSKLNPQMEREGSVFRSYDGKISFKVINNLFLIKNSD